ncbi:chymotrypsin-1-like isoform X1 [Pectinophora gossypiella]|uniref:chymotrypsin-1-like isoform X1 n=1 Tax=Pectinophora gossypiella TaxID=13191 RepID=UPI00214E6525|nr:chymotrypsin-1-like isoform X1 [Pectinophora gossypiella]
MGVKIGLPLAALLAVSFAIPTRVGIPSPENQSVSIIGGDPAPEGSAPYMAAVVIGAQLDSFWCGGSIISRRTILSTAHCLRDQMGVIVGTNHWASGGTKYSVTKSIRHPGYNHTMRIHDLGLIITALEIKFTEVISPVALGGDFVGGGVLARATGWGLTKFPPILTGSDVLMELNITSIEGEECKKIFKPHNVTVYPDVELCLLNSTGHGMCFGDSGSPAVRVDKKEQIGIVSWGTPCAKGYPDVFTRISVHKKWITENTVGALD